jgi:hypothetical protein
MMDNAAGQIFGASEAQSDPSRVVDVEFIFPSDDAVVLLRAASRVPPSDTTGTLKLSFTDSPLVFDRNYSRYGGGGSRRAGSLRACPALRLLPSFVFREL